MRWLSIVALVLAAGLGVGVLLGGQSAQACFWAAVVNAISSCGAFVPILYCLLYRPAVLATGILAAGVIRLLLTIAGAGIILLLVNVDVLWFAVWLGLFYLTLVATEVYFAVRMLHGQSGTLR